MAHLDAAILNLADAVRQPEDQGWSWLVRQRMAVVKQALQATPTGAAESWLTARSTCAMRSRNQLLDRIGELGPQVLEAEAAAVRDPMERLLQDLEHHRQRLTDLVYDSVELELGGSE